MDDRHVTSLLAPYNDNFVDTALSDWLGLGHGYEQMPEDLSNFADLEIQMASVDINDDENEKQTTENEEKINEDEKVDDKQEQKNDEEVNEEEEEEQRRRDELDNIEDDFVPSEVIKPQTTVSNSANETIILKDGDDDQGEWQVVKKKPYDRRRMIRHILQYPTTLTDQTVSLINDDVWQLPNDQRHDLYRYWLLKYQQCLHNSVRGARHEYNQAAAALAEYHQEEDYHILKDSVIVAMTTTCAAKYHTVLEKLRKRKNYF
jgi:hypothetical protein